MFKVSMGRASALKVVVAGVVLLALFAGGCVFGDSGKKEQYVNKINDLTK